MSSVLPIQRRHLAATLALVARCFPTDVGYRWAMPLCALDGPLDEVRRAAGLALARQWVAADERDNIVGTFGLYATHEDVRPQNRFVALNWFCVDPEFRGQGLGRRLWAEVVREAAAAGAHRLIFYSSTEAHHLRAEKLYLAAGCARRFGHLLPDGTHRLTYFDLPLGSAAPADPVTTARIDDSLARLFAIDSDRSLITSAESASANGALVRAA